MFLAFFLTLDNLLNFNFFHISSIDKTLWSSKKYLFADSSKNSLSGPPWSKKKVYNRFYQSLCLSIRITEAKAMDWNLTYKYLAYIQTIFFYFFKIVIYFMAKNTHKNVFIKCTADFYRIFENTKRNKIVIIVCFQVK